MGLVSFFLFVSFSVLFSFLPICLSLFIFSLSTFSGMDPGDW